MKINPAIFQPLIDEKLVSVQKHPEFDYYIYNYTKKAKFEGIEAWTPELRMCRGLILDGDGNVIARPFDKFFNLEQHKKEEIPNIPFKAYDKMDGSLGILYKCPDGYYAIATRGSFVSEQAIEGTKILQEMLLKGDGGFSDGQTYLYEIIYPSNRVVVDYGERRELVLLAIRDIESGEVVPIGRPISDYQSPRDNAEGVVLYYDNGFMCKVKYEEYVRLHRLVTGVNARRIWDVLRSGGGLKEFTTRVPEEFERWINKTAQKLRYEYETIEVISQDAFDEVVNLPTRKEQAEIIMKEYRKYSGIIFAMLDDKPYKQIIWKMLYPSHEVPFKALEESNA